MLNPKKITSNSTHHGIARAMVCAFVLLILFMCGAVSADIPPNPTNIANTTGNFWINHTWEVGSESELYLISGAKDGTYDGYNWTGSAWQSDSGMVSGLITTNNARSAPTVFKMDSTYYLVAGDSWGAVKISGYNWTGSAWQVDSGIISGITGIGDFITPEAFEMGGTWYIVSGQSTGIFYGFNWTGSAWQSDSGIISGLVDVGLYSAPTVFNIGETWYLISGEVQGAYVGYNWTGSAWQVDSGIISGLGDTELLSTPDVFQKDGTQYLISGDDSGIFIGFNWTGSAWQADSTINSSLVDIGDNSYPEVFYMEGVANDIDSYNVSVNDVWYNTTTDTFYNDTYTAHDWQNTTVYSFNSSGNGNLSVANISQETQISNNVMTITNTSDWSGASGANVYVDYDATDADSDTPTFSCNRTDLFTDFITTTGKGNWTPIDGTYYVDFGVSDGYGSTDNYTMIITATPSVFEITLHSVSPETIYTNHTGVIQANYIVESTNPLNLSTLAFLYGVNYTITGDMHSYVAIPPNPIASEGMYRAPNRNTTPHLSWEDNATITEGNVWQWGGGDNSSWWITKTPINATHTWINITGIAEHIFQSSFYLKKTSMYSAPKTEFEINQQQGLIIKMWDNEIIRGRSLDYILNLYFDTDWESTIPTQQIEIWGLNSSFNPDTDDPSTSEFGGKIVEWDGNRWVNHSWVPGSNASYSYPLTFNASSFPVVPDEINYIYLKSTTISSKSYVLNATNYDPGICNITFAQTETMWTYNEISDVSTQVAYTPSFFVTFVRDDEEFLHHLYIADDQGAWAHSEINNISIGVSSYPVPASSIDYFNITCPTLGYTLDTRMDATYDGGYFHIGINCPADPDGGVVSHNLTIHYVNETIVGIINDTFTTSGDELIEINFSTTSYYSTDDAYVLKCVSTDDEGSIATVWMDSHFTLAADGTQGYYLNDYLSFWGMNDIPTLHTVINNNSLISYDAGGDIYTMHIPFFKSKCNDTFLFNETVHLQSLNNEDVAYFRFGGDTKFDNATVHGWNTTTDMLAPDTDAYRGYLFSCCRTDGNITNSNLSYLGSDIYRQDGLNFVENTLGYLIYNTTLSHNSRGIIIENCENYNISHCTIADNAEAGVGIFYSENTIVENCTITDSAYDPGIYLYESNNNIIKDNIIQYCVYYGIWLRSNCDNNTLIGNNISGSGIYDYYFTSASINNTIRDPASDTDKIRVTSTSEVNIENTDNAVFEEDSSNSTYAYLTNFSMSVTGLSHTFDITQRNMTITPETDNVRIRDLNWEGINVTFNASTDTAGNPVWFNITKPMWAGMDISVYRNGITFYEGTADTAGTFEYNYTGGWSEWYFTFAGTPEVEPVTNLHPTTRIHNKIVWEWINPDNYDTIMVYLDNVWKQNITGTAYSALGLTQTTSYTIKLITVHEGTESVPVTDTQVTPAEQGGSGGGGGTIPAPTPTPTATPEPTVTPTPMENVTENATIVIELIPDITENVTSDYTVTGSIWNIRLEKHAVFVPEQKNIIACYAVTPYACRYYDNQKKFEIVIDGESPKPTFEADQWVTFITQDGDQIRQRINTKVYNPMFYFTMSPISGSVGDFSKYFVHGDEYVVDGVRFWWIGIIGAIVIIRWRKK